MLASLKKKKVANRGIINGPFCVIYGFEDFFTAFTGELTESGYLWVVPLWHLW